MSTKFTKDDFMNYLIGLEKIEGEYRKSTNKLTDYLALIENKFCVIGDCNPEYVPVEHLKELKDYLQIELGKAIMKDIE